MIPVCTRTRAIPEHADGIRQRAILEATGNRYFRQEIGLSVKALCIGFRFVAGSNFQRQNTTWRVIFFSHQHIKTLCLTLEGQLAEIAKHFGCLMDAVGFYAQLEIFQVLAKGHWQCIQPV